MRIHDQRAEETSHRLGYRRFMGVGPDGDIDPRLGGDELGVGARGVDDDRREVLALQV
jgi:hypothetical protein